eukprot:gene10192-3160_t
MLHTLFILDNSGEVVIEKHWRGKIARSVVDDFWTNYATKSGYVPGTHAKYPYLTETGAQDGRVIGRKLRIPRGGGLCLYAQIGHPFHADTFEEILPVIATAKFVYVHIRVNDVFFLGITQTETPPMLVLELL